MRVLIADDHAIVRKGLRQIVAQEADIQIVGEAADAGELLKLVARVECDVVVLDIGMPGRSGLEALKDLRYARPGLPVLVLSMYPEEQLAVRMLRAGAAGYLTKEAAPELLVQALRRVRAGGRFVSENLGEQLARQLSRPAGDAPHEQLSDREYSVLCLFGAGRTVTQIAERLSLSVKTVSTYRSRILEKMELRSTSELIEYAVRHRLSEHQDPNETP